MVSFSCAGCGDVLTKKKLNGHVNQCWGAAFTCIDCMTDFQGNSYMSHTSCMSEAQKYQGHLYRPEKEKKGNNRNQQNQQNNQNKQNNQQGYNHNQKAVQPYVEEEVENRVAIVEIMPEAPTPPSAVPDFEPATESKPNVFDFYAGQATPNASTADLTKYATAATAVVKFDAETPAPKKKREEKKEPKSDKKRKRLHVDTSGSSSVDRDLEMPDVEGGDSAVPGLHTGLTGGLKQLMPRDGFFPPTPISSEDAETPVKAKKTKKAKKEPSLMARMGSNLINSAAGRRTSSGSNGKKEHDEDKPRKKTKAIEYNKATTTTEDGAVIPFAPQLEPEAMAAQLMAFVPVETGDKGVSMDKALKRYHRLRKDSGEGIGKREEEELLWKALRMKRNEAGEIVLFFAASA